MSRKDHANRLVSAIKKLSLLDPTRTLNELRVLIAMERVVARLESHFILREHVIFKGGFVLLKIPRSFADAASEFDLKLMKAAWMSVEIDTKVERFEDHWSRFISNLQVFL